MVGALTAIAMGAISESALANPLLTRVVRYTAVVEMMYGVGLWSRENPVSTVWGHRRLGAFRVTTDGTLDHIVTRCSPSATWRQLKYLD